MGFFVSDSEVEESPFFRTTNLWKLQPDGTVVQLYSLLNFTSEPTGLAFDSGTGRLYISDDDQFKIFWVDPANPTVKLGEFDLRHLGCNDPEDVAVNPNNGHLFIVNGDQVAGPTARFNHRDRQHRHAGILDHRSARGNQGSRGAGL
jgi:hypothetical protein